MLIDVSYFTSGPRHILNALAESKTVQGVTVSAMPNQNQLSVNKAIMGYVKHYQLAFLCEMLGDTLAVEIDGYLAAKDAAEKEEQDFDVNEGYEMLCAKLRESFADYVFFYILRDGATQATDRGLVIWKNDNEVVSPIQRQVAIWNEMVNRNIRFKAWAAAQSATPYCLVAVSDNMLTRINPFNL